MVTAKTRHMAKMAIGYRIASLKRIKQPSKQDLMLLAEYRAAEAELEKRDESIERVHGHPAATDRLEIERLLTPIVMRAG